jgi:hypothetical protein
MIWLACALVIVPATVFARGLRAVHAFMQARLADTSAPA